MKMHWVGERQRMEKFCVQAVRGEYTVCVVVFKKLFSFYNFDLECYVLLIYKVDCCDLAEFWNSSAHTYQYDCILLVCVAISSYPFSPEQVEGYIATV